MLSLVLALYGREGIVNLPGAILLLRNDYCKRQPVP